MEVGFLQELAFPRALSVPSKVAQPGILRVSLKPSQCSVPKSLVIAQGPQTRIPRLGPVHYPQSPASNSVQDLR